MLPSTTQDHTAECVQNQIITRYDKVSLEWKYSNTPKHRSHIIYELLYANINANNTKQKQKNSYSPAGNCMFKVNNRNTRARCEICSKLTIKTPERR